MAEIEGITSELLDNHMIINVANEAANSDVFAAVREDLAANSEEHGERAVLIELSQVTMLPSMVLGDLVQIKNVLTPKKRRLMLVGLKPDLRRVFALTKLDKLFEMHDSVDEALTHLAPK